LDRFDSRIGLNAALDPRCAMQSIAGQGAPTGKTAAMEKAYETLALIYFAAASLVLMLMAFLLLATVFWEIVSVFTALDALKVVDSIGILVIGFAVVETAKFIAEEELLRQRELRSALESRRSLTKFVTIIVIAASLEALVMIFKSSRTNLEYVLYPSLLLVGAMAALVSLGIYQWLSSRIKPQSGNGDRSR
jgi:hypothetical protein